MSKNNSVKFHFRHYARVWVMQFLFQCDFPEEESEKIEEKFAYQLRETDLYELPEKDIFKKAYKASLKLLAGLIPHISNIDERITLFSSKSDWPVERIDGVDKNIMRIAVYEMLFCDNIPRIVSINEAVEIGKEYGSEHSAAFINGILNSIKNSLPQREEKEGAPQDNE